VSVGQSEQVCLLSAAPSIGAESLWSRLLCTHAEALSRKSGTHERLPGVGSRRDLVDDGILGPPVR